MKNYIEIRKSLEKLYDRHQHDIASDPIQFPRRYKYKKDQELVAFVSAMYAFGHVKVIFRTLENICRFFGAHPHQRVMELDCKESFVFLTHRWVKPADTISMFRLLQNILTQFGTLEKYFMQFYDSKDETIERSLNGWLHDMKTRLRQIQKTELSHGQKFLFASPDGGSTTKRAVMFLRWMVRTGDPDLGLWKRIPSSKLMMPLDAHLFRFSQYFGFTKQKQPGWKSVEESTMHFRKVCSEDPVRYDFALARLGILGLCEHHVSHKCLSCMMQQHCGLFHDQKIGKKS